MKATFNPQRYSLHFFKLHNNKYMQVLSVTFINSHKMILMNIKNECWLKDLEIVIHGVKEHSKDD